MYTWEGEGKGPERGAHGLQQELKNPLPSLGVILSFNLISAPGGFPGGSDGKESARNAGNGSIPRSGRTPGEGNGKPLQYSCLENPMDRGTWWATVHGVAKSGHD